MTVKNKISYLHYRNWIVYIWLLALIIYFSHMLFENGPITKYAQGIVDIINLYCLFRVVLQIKKYPRTQRNIIKSLIFVLVICILYFVLTQKTAIISFDGQIASSFSQLKILFVSIGSIFPAIYYTQKRILDSNVLKVSFYLLWVFSVLTFISYRTTLYELTGNENATNNMGYLIVSIFPLCMFVKSPFRYIYWLSCLFIVLVGAKRGAILLGVSLVAISLWISTRNLKKYQKFLFLALAGIALYYFGSEYASFFEYSLDRFSDGQFQNSARDRIIHQILDGMSEGSPIHYLIGYGSLGSVNLAENFAHNDWLEFLADYGLLGLIPYAIVFILLIRLYFNYRKVYPTESFVLLLAIVCMLYRSAFSMCFFSIDTSVLMLALGYTMTCKLR